MCEGIHCSPEFWIIFFILILIIFAIISLIAILLFVIAIRRHLTKLENKFDFWFNNSLIESKKIVTRTNFEPHPIPKLEAPIVRDYEIPQTSVSEPYLILKKDETYDYIDETPKMTPVVPKKPVRNLNTSDTSSGNLYTPMFENKIQENICRAMLYRQMMKEAENKKE